KLADFSSPGYAQTDISQAAYGFVGSGQLALSGNQSTPTNVFFQGDPGIRLSGPLPVSFTVDGVALKSLWAINGARMFVGAIWFWGGSAGAQVYVVNHSTVAFLANYSMAGPASQHYAAQIGSIITANGLTFNVHTASGYTQFAQSWSASVLQVVGSVFGGA